MLVLAGLIEGDDGEVQPTVTVAAHILSMVDVSAIPMVNTAPE